MKTVIVAAARRIEPKTLTYLNIPLSEFIWVAYDIRRYRIVAPDWVINIATRDRYDVVAKAAAPASERDLRAMLGPLLRERFHLAYHRETRVLPVYLLTVDKGGPKFKEGDGDSSTGLTGRYTFSVNLQELPAGLSPADQKSAEFRSDTPAFTALQEQLGLKLVPDRAPIEMLVVDHVDRVPTDD